MDYQENAFNLPGNSQIRIQWLVEEDILIAVFVEKFGTRRWNIIADELKDRVPGSNRNGKQCRERWHNHLDPKVRKSPWNANEEFVFIESHKMHGNKWAEISKHIPGRTDNSIKNHFYSTLRKQISRLQKFDICNEIYQDETCREQTAYYIQCLRKIIIMSEGVSAAGQPGDGPKLAQFDIYLIRKLKESNLNLKTIDQYLLNLDKINQAYHSLVKQQVINPNAPAGFEPKDPGNPFKVQIVGSGIPKKIFKIEQDVQRLIEREIKKMKVFKDPKIWLEKHTKHQESFQCRVQNIQERVRVLRIQYQAEIEPTKLRRDMFEMLKKIKVTPQLNKDGILDGLRDDLSNQKKSLLKINITAAKSMPIVQKIEPLNFKPVQNEIVQAPSEMTFHQYGAGKDFNIQKQSIQSYQKSSLSKISIDPSIKNLQEASCGNFYSSPDQLQPAMQTQNQFQGYKFTSDNLKINQQPISDLSQFQPQHQKMVRQGVKPPSFPQQVTFQNPSQQPKSSFGNHGFQGYSIRASIVEPQQPEPQNVIQEQAEFPKVLRKISNRSLSHQHIGTAQNSGIQQAIGRIGQMNQVRKEDSHRSLDKLMQQVAPTELGKFSLNQAMNLQINQPVPAPSSLFGKYSLKNVSNPPQKMVDQKSDSQSIRSRIEEAIKKKSVGKLEEEESPFENFKVPEAPKSNSKNSNNTTQKNPQVVSSHQKQLQKMNQQIELAQTENTFIRRKSISMNNLNIDSDTLQHLRQLNKQYQAKKEEPSISSQSQNKYKNFQPATNKNDPAFQRITQQENKIKRMDSINISEYDCVSVSNDTDSQAAMSMNKIKDDQFYNQQRDLAANFNIKDLKSLHSASQNQIDYPTVQGLEVQSTLNSSIFQVREKSLAIHEIQDRMDKIEAEQRNTQQLLREAIEILQQKGDDRAILNQLRAKVNQTLGQVEDVRQVVGQKSKKLPRMNTVKTLIEMRTEKTNENTKQWPGEKAQFQFKKQEIRSKSKFANQPSANDLESSFSLSSFRRN